ncbi:DUF4129 domain-containing protein [Cryobacterium sp. RTS3]|uniref:DUF4129 domain-containing protein n=1 Tax=Cryobacterium sp. RTS3 TaxID=3048643 RepID=UPI002B235B6F|nr:DUF4129 domain-containing protein [Cryobacterium sp. RTS3]MEB0000718.1 DUF4129 domain-containing protein [Cryobacterium sp. RTS3]
MTGAWGTWAGTLPASIPVDPDAPTATAWLRDELAKPPYEAARPTWFDRVSKAFFDWFASLGAPSGAGLGPWVPLVVTLVIIAVVVVAVLVFGLPRWNRRSGLQQEVFGSNDARSADELRRAALSAASHKDWDLAISEMFRALARSLVERTVLFATPGTTAHGLAERAATAFPEERISLQTAAALFDGVRYLGAEGTESGFLSLAALESALRTRTPRIREDPAPTATQ